MKPIRLCWVLPDIGIYHRARFDAFSSSASGSSILEIGGVSGFPQFKSDKECGFSITTLFPEKSSSQIPTPELRRAIFKGLEEVRPEVVCVPGWGERIAFISLHWCLTHEIPAIVMSESHALDRVRWPWIELIKRHVVQLFSAGLVGGRPHAEYLAGLGVPRAKIFQGCDVVDNDYFSNMAAAARRNEATIREQLSLPDKYFLASARFIFKKNIFRLLEAYDGYRRIAGETAWKLVLLGDGPLMMQVTDSLEALSLGKNVFIPGFREYTELPSYYGLASAFVHASVSEQWGLVVNEAMASGLPVLVSERCGCALDLVTEGENGFTFNPYDIENLSRLMMKMASGEMDLDVMGRASRKIISLWSPERFATGLRNAAEVALTDSTPKADWADALLLQALAMR